VTDLEPVARALEARLPGRVERDVSLADYTPYRLGGPAAVFVHVTSVADALALASVVRHGDGEGVPVLVVGRGSNLLVADRGFPGIVVHPETETDAEVAFVRLADGHVATSAAVPLPVLARQLAAQGLTGVEFFVGIPGSVGGAVRMNAGGHGRETAEVLSSAEVVRLDTGAAATLAAADLTMAYRSTNLAVHDLVMSATFTVVPDDPTRCEARIAEVVRWRREHQPGGANAGSVFTNPEGDSAGRIIDACGLKGLRVGGASVSEKHANFFQADSGATADDVRALISEVRRRVHDATGIELEPELRMVAFD